MNDEYVKEISMEKLEELKTDFALRRMTQIGFILSMDLAVLQDRIEVTVSTSKDHTISYVTYLVVDTPPSDIEIHENQLTLDTNANSDCGGVTYLWTCPDCKEILVWAPRMWWDIKCCRDWDFEIKVTGKKINS